MANFATPSPSGPVYHEQDVGTSVHAQRHPNTSRACFAQPGQVTHGACSAYSTDDRIGCVQGSVAELACGPAVKPHRPTHCEGPAGKPAGPDNRDDFCAGYRSLGG
jgi:hypothetical protein